MELPNDYYIRLIGELFIRGRLLEDELALLEKELDEQKQEAPEEDTTAQEG